MRFAGWMHGRSLVFVVLGFWALAWVCRAGAAVGAAVALELDRADGRYIERDVLQVTISCGAAGRLRVFQVGGEGTAMQVFPNGVQRDCRVTRGQRLRVPGDSGFRLLLGPPFGEERLVAILSPGPFLDREHFEWPAGAWTVSLAPGADLLRLGVGDGVKVACAEVRLKRVWVGCGDPAIGVFGGMVGCSIWAVNAGRSTGFSGLIQRLRATRRRWAMQAILGIGGIGRLRGG